MWKTPFGERVLTGAEGRLFREALTYLVDYVEQCIEIEEECYVGVTAFDNLSNVQKLAMLEAVGLALLRPRIPCPEHTAVNEATIAAVLANLLTGIEMEVGRGRPDPRPDGDGQHEWLHFSWRDLVVAALGENGDEEIPDPTSTDMDEWRETVERIEEWILWDLDWDNDEAIEADRVARTLSGRSRRTYYGTPGPDPATIPVDAIRETFREMRLECRDESKGIKKVLPKDECE
jgi:hypothetical protein